MEKIVRASINNAITALQLCQNQLAIGENTRKIKIDSSYFLKDYCKIRNITTCDEHKEVFNALKAIKSPVLYWFEFKPIKGLCPKIREVFVEYKNLVKGNYKHPKYRNTSSFKKNFNHNSKTLYVGKVETYFWGRIVTHLGYAKNKKTAGMQLYQWYKVKKFGNITLKYIVFENEMKYLVPALEKELAQKLEPIIGRY